MRVTSKAPTPCPGPTRRPGDCQRGRWHPTPLGALRPARRSPAVCACLTDRDACPGDSTHLGGFSPSLSPRKCPTHTGKRGCRPFWKKSLRECEQVKIHELRGDGSRCPLPVRRGSGDRHTGEKVTRGGHRLGRRCHEPRRQGLGEAGRPSPSASGGGAPNTVVSDLWPQEL